MSSKGCRSNEMCTKRPVDAICAHLNYEDGYREASMRCDSN